MNDILQFPKIKAWPCNLNDTSSLDIFSPHQCEKEIKETFRDHLNSMFIAHRYKYPIAPKDLYIVPFSQEMEARKLGLSFAEFSALWLPSVASSILKIRQMMPDELKDSPIVAWDNNFSTFKGNRILHVDPGFGEVLFVMPQRNGYGRPPDDWQFLAELR
jgi:hypothetical protein